MRNYGLFLQLVGKSASCNVPCWATCLWSPPPTLDIAVFFYIVFFFCSSAEKTLVRALGVFSTLCFSLVLILGIFFQYIHPLSFSLVPQLLSFPLQMVHKGGADNCTSGISSSEIYRRCVCSTTEIKNAQGIFNNWCECLQRKHTKKMFSVYTWEAVSAREMITNVLKTRE